MAVDYEWKIEELDDAGDIIECHFSERLRDFATADFSPQTDGVTRVAVCLVRDVWCEAEGLTDRLHAYASDTGALVYNEEPSRHVPQRYQREFEANKDKLRRTWEVVRPATA